MMGENIIVTRHAGLIEWLRARGIRGRVIEHVRRSDIRDKHIYGSLPYFLAAETATYTTISIPRSRTGNIQDRLTCQEMEELGAYMTTYEVSYHATK